MGRMKGNLKMTMSKGVKNRAVATEQKAVAISISANCVLSFVSL